MNCRFNHLCAAAALAALLCTGAMGAPSAPKDAAQAKAKLAAVRARISELTRRLGADLAQRDGVSARLREAELAITAKRQRLDALHVEQAAAERRQAQLRGEQARALSSLDAKRGALAAQIQAAYMIGPQEPLKLLLNQSNPASLGRTLTYYGYFAQQRSGEIAAIQSDMSRLEQLLDEIGQQAETLKTLEGSARGEMTDLQAARGERAGALAALSKRVASGNQELGRLKAEEQAVESLVADLARVIQDFPVDASQGFGRMRGKLPWPVLGKMTTHYQEPRVAGSSAIRWNGVMIQSTRGAKVRAAYFGRVVYADWLQGLGLLIIIGHSGGYMTLYGHAEVLYKSVGDQVAPGDVIAALGDGSGAAPQLYFEIREGRKTVDPKVWLQPKP